MADDSVPVLLTGVTSVTHLVYAASWLRSQLDSGARLDLFVAEPGSFFGQTRVTPEDVETYLPHDDRLRITHGGRTAYAAVGTTPEVLLSVGAPGLKAFAELTRLRKRPPRVVVVDEGIGSYGDARTRRAAYRRAGGGGLWPVVRAAAVAGGHRLLTSERWTTYRRPTQASGWEVNEVVAAEFSRHLDGEVAPPQTAVYLTQPWPRLGVMGASAYVRHLDGVARACDTVGLHLVVQPHPADDPADYADFDVRPQARPVELDRFVTSAAVVIGSNSTALLNLAALEGVSTVRVTMAETQELEDALGADQRDLLDHFLPPAVTTTGLAAALDARRDGPGPSAD